MNTNPSFQIVQQFIKAVLTIVKDGYCFVHIDNLHWLKTAFYQAVKFNQVTDTSIILETILDYEINHGHDNLLGLWGYAFEILNDKGVKVTDELAQRVRTEMEERFSRIETALLNNEVDLNTAQRAFTLLSTYFGKNDKPKLKLLFDRYSKMVQQKAIASNVFQHLREIENLHLIAKSFGYKSEAKALAITIRELSSQTLPHVKLLSSEMQVNKELIDSLYQFFSESEKATIIQSLIICFLPQIEQIREQLKNIVKVIFLNNLWVNNGLEKKV